MARPLDRELPPWEAHVLAGPDPDSFAVLFKFHHALADGLGALALAATLFDEGPALRPSARPVPEQRAGSALRRLPGVLAARVQDVGQALEIGAAVARAGLPLGVPAALTADPAAPGPRAVAGLALDLDEVNLVRKAAGGTVNDVLISVVAGALRRWLEERGDPAPAGPGPRALIPVSRRGRPPQQGRRTRPRRGGRRPARGPRPPARPPARRPARRPGRPAALRHPGHERPAAGPDLLPRRQPGPGGLPVRPAGPRAVAGRRGLHVQGDGPLRRGRRRRRRPGPGRTGRGAARGTRRACTRSLVV